MRVKARAALLLGMVAFSGSAVTADPAPGGPVQLQVASPSAPAASLALSADTAVRLGLERNPQIAAGQAGVASAAGNYRSLAAFPAIQLGVTHAHGTSTAPTLNGETSDTFVDVGATVDTSGQRRYQAAGAHAQLRATRYQLAETRLTLEQQIRDAYWSLVAAQAQTAIALESLREVERVHELTRTQEQAGSAPRQDVVRSSIDVANAQQAYVTAQGAERTSLSALNVLLARPPFAAVTLADSLTTATTVPSPLPVLPELAELQRLAAANRPLLKAAREQVRVAEYALRQARASRFPDLSVDYERSVQSAAPTDSVIVAARFPLLDFGAVSGAIRAAAETRKQAEAQVLQAQQQVEQQVAQAHTDYAQAQTLAASYRTDILAPSETLLQMAQIGYRQGATGILPVIDAETTLRNARTGYIAALLALYKARDEVYAATGGLSTPAPGTAPGAGKQPSPTRPTRMSR